jgi:hypothetical protein
MVNTSRKGSQRVIAITTSNIFEFWPARRTGAQTI